MLEFGEGGTERLGNESVNFRIAHTKFARVINIGRKTLQGVDQVLLKTLDIFVLAADTDTPPFPSLLFFT